jgi:hypothetical protein
MRKHTSESHAERVARLSATVRELKQQGADPAEIDRAVAALQAAVAEQPPAEAPDADAAPAD